MSGHQTAGRLLPTTLVLVALVSAVVGSLGAPLITAVSAEYHVSLAAAQWTLTIALLSGVVATPILGRLGSGSRRRPVVLVTLATVAAGGALSVPALPFWLLLVGRAAQGVGLGVTALLMATAREHLPPDRAASTIALLSVTSTAGIGVGYPLAGLLTDLADVHAAYALGLAVSVLALVTAWLGLPDAKASAPARVDWTGGVLLAAGLLTLLIAISQTGPWRDHPALMGLVTAAALAALAVWTLIETRRPAPLVDVRLLRHPAVAAANTAMLAAGAGMYLLLSLITRYVQTPSGVGYGFGLDTFRAGLVLVPFSVLGFAAGKLAPWMRRRAGAPSLLAGSVAVVLAAFAVFGTARGDISGPVVAMSVLGFGVGAFSAAMPALILGAVPPHETASAMSVNQVVRSTGFALGSALAGLILAGHPRHGSPFPSDGGYTTAAWIGAATMLLAALAIPLAGRRPRA
ncbi:MFS transporter [Actinomadura darangshiensis]|uniref:MFS transporter n=1 Tax=Actinomadura darangshiensis TaxID=705336 RepID=A0A4R5ASQ3_9ACTN|nr:MFS transporter [Actinomadura darangshiensis]TDD73452.1 MFS transporter [Actinomadura darangshiensis]